MIAINGLSLRDGDVFMSLSFEDKLAAEMHAIKIMLCLIAVDHLSKYEHPLAALAALAGNGHASADAYRVKAETPEAESEYKETIHERIDAMASTIHAALRALSV